MWFYTLVIFTRQLIKGKGPTSQSQKSSLFPCARRYLSLFFRSLLQMEAAGNWNLMTAGGTAVGMKFAMGLISVQLGTTTATWSLFVLRQLLIAVHVDRFVVISTVNISKTFQCGSRLTTSTCVIFALTSAKDESYSAHQYQLIHLY